MLRVFSSTTTFSGSANYDVSLRKYIKMALKNLPLGISTLSKLLENNAVYVDKTEYAYHLTTQPGAFFLSRPRRFGKSLFVDTLKEIFEGNQKLFEGLYIYDKWDWTRKYPVIKLDFAGGGSKESGRIGYSNAGHVGRKRGAFGDSNGVTGFGG
jgi:hypothetical protein